MGLVSLVRRAIVGTQLTRYGEDQAYAHDRSFTDYVDDDGCAGSDGVCRSHGARRGRVARVCGVGFASPGFAVRMREAGRRSSVGRAADS